MCIFQFNINVVNFKEIARKIFLYTFSITHLVHLIYCLNMMSLFIFYGPKWKNFKILWRFQISVQGWAHSFWQKQCCIKSLFFHFEEHCLYCCCSLLHKLILAGHYSGIIQKKKKATAVVVCLSCSVGPLSRQGPTHWKRRLFNLPISQHQTHAKFYM